MNIPHPFPYQGSKRQLAARILAYLPPDTERLIEPFAGSGAVSMAAAHSHRVNQIALNDLNAPLIDLWRQIVEQPDQIADQYQILWEAQTGQERVFYDQIRDEFNRTCRPDHFLYLLARCVKSAVRYNAQGEFNQSPDNRRKGMHPKTMRRNLCDVSRLLTGKVQFSAVDYRVALNDVQLSDFVYLDPPYQGVSGKRDARYTAGVDFDDLLEMLCMLTEQGICFVLSYDGKTDSKTFGVPLPASLGLRQIELCAGRSAQATLLGQNKVTYESLYISSALQNKSIRL